MSTFFARLPSGLVGMEACASAHYWARELMALGHTVRLMPAHYVKPDVKRGKTDAAEAEAIAEAVTRPSMRFVPVKTVDQQGVLMLHRTRDLLVRQRTMLINALRAPLGEIGMVGFERPSRHRGADRARRSARHLSAFQPASASSDRLSRSTVSWISVPVRATSFLASSCRNTAL